MSLSLQQKKQDPIGHRAKKLWSFYVAGLVFARYTLKGMEIQFHGGVMGHRGKNWKPGSEGDIKMLVVMLNPTHRCPKI